MEEVTSLAAMVKAVSLDDVKSGVMAATGALLTVSVMIWGGRKLLGLWGGR